MGVWRLSLITEYMLYKFGGENKRKEVACQRSNNKIIEHREKNKMPN